MLGLAYVQEELKIPSLMYNLKTKKDTAVLGTYNELGKTTKLRSW